MDVDDEASDSQLTWKQGVEHFQNAFNNSVKCYGSSKNKPKELYVADILHNNGITRLADKDAILTLIGKMQRFSAFKERTMQFMSFPTPESKMKRKMSFLAWQPVTGLVSTLPRGKRDDLIITPIETTENNVVDNGIIEVDNSNNPTMEEVQRQTCIIKNSVVDTMLQCINKLNNGEMEHGLIRRK